MDPNWQTKLNELSSETEPNKNSLIRDQVAKIIETYQQETPVNTTQLQLTINISVGKYEPTKQFKLVRLPCTVESLMFAVQENNIIAVRGLLQLDSGLRNAKDSNEDIPIHVALELGYEDIAELLIEPPANLDVVDDQGNTLLHLAAEYKQNRIFASLKQRYPVEKIFEANENQNNCIHVALRSGNNELVKFIFRKLQNINYGVLGYKENTYLHFAAHGNCDDDILTFLISKTPDINCTNFFKNTPLHEALISGSQEAARLLCKHGSNVTMIGMNNKNCYHFAAQGRCCNVIDDLAEMKDNINEKSDNGTAPLHEALLASSIATIEKLIENGANLYTLDNTHNSIFHYVAKKNLSDLLPYLDNSSPLMCQHNQSGYTPLYISIKKNSYLVFKYFIKNNVDINKQCKKTNKSPLHAAAILGNWCYVYGLLLNGADPDAKSNNGRTPIQLALLCRHPVCVEILLLYAENIDKHFCNDGYGVMHYAMNCSPKIVTKILEANNRCSLHTINNNTNETLYHSAIKFNNLEVVQYLISKNVPQTGQVLPVHLAGCYGDVAIFETLLDQLDDDDIKAKDPNGKSILEYIISSGKKDKWHCFEKRLQAMKTPIELSELSDIQNVLRFAVQQGCPDILYSLSRTNYCIYEMLNNLDKTGFLPLHCAAKTGNLSLAEALISLGADKNVVADQNRTALHIAVLHNKIEMVKYLVKIGLTIDAQDDRGYTAVHFAVVEGFEDILIYLIQNHASTKLTSFEDHFTPLLMATVLNRVNVMKYLVECDENVHADEHYIKSVLKVVAITAGSHDALEFINNYKGPNLNIIELLTKDADEML